VKTRQELRSAHAAYQAVQNDVERLRLEKARLEAEVEALRTNPEVIERLARKELNMLRPDEFVLSFPDQPQPGKSQHKSPQRR
jgi:cell division protein FtsB